jgi:hypothetical protein
MKSLVKTSEIHEGLLKINKKRALYYQKASEKIHELNLKAFLNTMLDGRKNETSQIHPITKPGPDVVSSTTKRNKLYRFRMKVKTMIANAYELE